MPKFSRLFNPLMLHSSEAYQSGGNLTVIQNMIARVRTWNWMNIFINIVLPSIAIIYAWLYLKDRYQRKQRLLNEYLYDSGI